MKKIFKLGEIQRILQIISANRIGSEKEMIALSELLTKANISSNDRGYERIVQMVRNYKKEGIHELW